MITLTTPPTINTVLGGSVPVAYEKMVLTQITIQPKVRQIQANITMTSNSAPDMPPITGNLTVDLAATPAVLTINVAQLNFFRRLVLVTAQITSIQSIIDGDQNTIESGLVSLGLVAGTQATGT